ncbi:phasin family protein [Lysobacter terrae]
MAKFKKTAKKTAAPTKRTTKTASKKASAAQAEQLSKTLSESAQQVWLAGVGAFSRAQTEGTKLFEALIKEGLKLEHNALKFAGGQADAVRGAVESKVGQARERATDTWDRLEKVFEDRVQRALTQLGVPGRDDLAELTRKVDSLTAELRKQNGKPAAKTAAKTARKPAVRKGRATPSA